MKLLQQKEEAGTIRRNASWKLRWLIARKLEGRRNWCWSQVVNWVYRYPEDGREENRLSYAHDVSHCWAGSLEENCGHGCYCGQWINGQYRGPTWNKKQTQQSNEESEITK